MNSAFYEPKHNLQCPLKIAALTLNAAFVGTRSGERKKSFV